MQVGKIATILSDRVPGTLPADTERNSNETVNDLKNDVDKKKKGQKKAENKRRKENSRREEPEWSEHMPALPFSQIPYSEKMDKQFERFLDVLKQVHVNLLFTEVAETGDPDKDEENRGDLSGQAHRALKLEKEIGKIRSAPISLQLADQTTLIPEGIVEDVLVRVDKFVFPKDFIVVKMEENKEVPLILGRPFLAAGRAILDIQEIKLMLRVSKETVTFKMEVEKGVQKDKSAASVEWKVKGAKEKAAVSEKYKYGVYP
ncbi:uncharacterized protein [Nicotiana tomentosiformis]|uniref:uncharacterized protein n=1 Tax=Nicotiana tomentosiformis TaxID=4098 RepID=UPI00388C3C69